MAEFDTNQLDMIRRAKSLEELREERRQKRKSGFADAEKLSDKFSGLIDKDDDIVSEVRTRG